MTKYIALLLFIIGLAGCRLNPPVSSTPQPQPTPPPVIFGQIEGSLSYPSQGIPPELTVCAVSISEQTEFCTENHLSDPRFEPNGIGYTLKVPIGEYHVYAFLPDQPDNKAYYSQFVTCGLNVNCPSHDPIAVTVIPEQTTSAVNPHDWYASPVEEAGDDESAVVCWNRVVQEDDTLYWRDGCRGAAGLESCTLAMVELSADEAQAYRAWVLAGSQTPGVCL